MWMFVFGIDLIEDLFDIFFDEELVVYVFWFFLILDYFGLWEVG